MNIMEVVLSPDTPMEKIERSTIIQQYHKRNGQKNHAAAAIERAPRAKDIVPPDKARDRGVRVRRR